MRKSGDNVDTGLSFIYLMALRAHLIKIIKGNYINHKSLEDVLFGTSSKLLYFCNKFI